MPSAISDCVPREQPFDRSHTRPRARPPPTRAAEPASSRAGAAWGHRQRMDNQMVSEVRSVNGVVTLRIGSLDEPFLPACLPRGRARVLWESGNDGVDVRAVRARLELDSGYLSELLRTLEGAGFVV